MKLTPHRDIEDFLSCKRLAMVGVSREAKDFSRALFDEFCRRGYDMVPVNPHMADVNGARCFARLQDVTPPVEGALVMTSPESAEQVVHDADAAGISHVWLYRAAGPGTVNDAALAFCEEHAMSVVAGYCPYMFFPKTPFFHRFHGFCLKVFGKYPPTAR